MNSRKRCLLKLAVAAVASMALAGDIKPAADESAMKSRIREWEQAVGDKMAADPVLKPLAAKYPLIVLPSRRHYGWSDYCGFSFIYETTDWQKSLDHDLEFDGGRALSFVTNFTIGQQNLITNLGNVDFEKDPDLKKVDIDGDGFWANQSTVVQGHVYLQRVRNGWGTEFFVLFKVVALGKDHEYMAFVWRKLPGGKVLRIMEKEDAKALYRSWEKAVDKKVADDSSLKALAAKHPLILLTSRARCKSLGKPGYNFAQATTSPRDANDLHILFDNGDAGFRFDIAGHTGARCLFADLGDVDFEKDPDPRKIAIEGDRAWMQNNGKAIDGHVYLLRIWEPSDNRRFHVLMKVVAVEEHSLYMAFLWRKLPGGKESKEKP